MSRLHMACGHARQGAKVRNVQDSHPRPGAHSTWKKTAPVFSSGDGNVSIAMGNPQNGWFIFKKITFQWMIRGYPYLLNGNLHISRIRGDLKGYFSWNCCLLILPRRGTHSVAIECHCIDF